MRCFLLHREDFQALLHDQSPDIAATAAGLQQLALEKLATHESANEPVKRRQTKSKKPKRSARRSVAEMGPGHHDHGIAHSVRRKLGLKDITPLGQCSMLTVLECSKYKAAPRPERARSTGLVFNTSQHDRQANGAAVQGPTRKLRRGAWRSCQSHAKATPLRSPR